MYPSMWAEGLALELTFSQKDTGVQRARAMIYYERHF